MNRLRICFVCSEYPPVPHGGIGTFTQVLARGLAAAGHEVRVTGVCRKGYAAPDYEVDEGVRVWRLRQSRGRFGWIANRYRLFKQISTWCRSGEVEVVEVPDSAGWAAGWPRLPVPVISRLNGSASYFAAELDNQVKRTTFWLERASLRRANYWCSVSEYTAQKTRDLFGLKTGPHAILYNPVESTIELSGQPRSEKDVVFSGTLAYKKGVVSLIEAWPQVLQQCPDSRLRLYGKDGRTVDGRSMKEMLLSKLDEKQRETVHFHGHADRPQLFATLQKARLAVFPSYAEAFAIAPLEAMACGCPTIYSTRGSGTELIDDGEDGLLVDPDSPGQIAEAIVRLLEDNQLAVQLGEAGRRRVEENFSINALLAKNVAFYQDCIGRKQLPINNPAERLNIDCETSDSRTLANSTT